MEDVPEIIVLIMAGVIFIGAVTYLLHPDVINGFVFAIYRDIADSRNYLN